MDVVAEWHGYHSAAPVSLWLIRGTIYMFYSTPCLRARQCLFVVLIVWLTGAIDSPQMASPFLALNGGTCDTESCGTFVVTQNRFLWFECIQVNAPNVPKVAKAPSK